MKRTPLVRRTPLRPMSAKLRRRIGDRQAFRSAVLARDRGTCQGCGKTAADAHHIVYRSQGGSDKPSNGIALCRPCHDEVHAHGRWYGAQLLKYVLKRTLAIAGGYLGVTGPGSIARPPDGLD